MTIPIIDILVDYMIDKALILIELKLLFDGCSRYFCIIISMSSSNSNSTYNNAFYNYRNSTVHNRKITV